ncbi:molybdenum cofactor biosynthesis protein MoaE [Rivihabitans pingtungensis]|uniref:molybdenum cofactor biosynthesis protein MoaE n=1 Tax=Rivihabitans pingtungensis TaxID=1054498 RepID=UPI0023F577CF|nr:molybdenum cofactor biosynthesis protein MoaE [Rivihabitans pingtungensis]
MSAAFTVTVQTARFDPGAEMAQLAGLPDVGAQVCFVGQVRDFGDSQAVTALELEHYPGMTEKSLLAILDQARARWPLAAARVVHRVGYLPLGEAIVLVLTASAHRGDAFAACEFIMDYLKRDAPFWKKEHTAAGSHWVEAKHSDQQAAQRWQ